MAHLQPNLAPAGGAASLPADPGMRSWKEIVAPYRHSDLRRSIWQLASTATLFFAAWVLAYRLLEVSYALTVLVAIPASFLLIRLFIFQHDCGHGSFFPSRRANDIVGSVIGVVMLTPYHYWRKTHAIHHATHGDLERREFGDIQTISVREYKARSRWGKLRYRLYRNLFVLLVIGPTYQFIFKHRLPLDAPRKWTREWASILWTDAALAAVALVAWQTFGLAELVIVHGTIMVITGAIGIWLFYVQHQFEDTYWESTENWDFHRAGLEGSSMYDLPRVLHWLTGNIGYHHIHHIASHIPNYNLRRAYEENPELQRVTRLSLLESLRCARLKLWDEDRRRLVTFREASLAERGPRPVEA